MNGLCSCFDNFDQNIFGGLWYVKDILPRVLSLICMNTFIAFVSFWWQSGRPDFLFIARYFFIQKEEKFINKYDYLPRLFFIP